MGLIGDIFKGISSKNAASAASGALQGGAKAALTEEQQAQQNALQTQQNATTTNATNEQPYQAVGSTAANHLATLLNGPGFTAPTLTEAEATPGYAFNLESGTNALEKGAAARGNLLSGTEGTALEQYGQGLGTTTYQQAFNNALNTYQNNFQDLLSGTNVGQTAVGEQGQLGQAGANNTANVDLTGANQQALQINNAAAARASGYLGKTAAINNMVDQGARTISDGLFTAGVM